MTTKTEKININLDSLFIITADREKENKTYEYTFYRISDALPTKDGKPMKAKEVFGSKSRAKIAKEEKYAHAYATELFSVEDVGIFFSERPAINGDPSVFKNFRLIEVKLPLPLDGIIMTSDIPVDANEGTFQDRSEDKVGAYIEDVAMNSDEIPF